MARGLRSAASRRRHLSRSTVKLGDEGTLTLRSMANKLRTQTTRVLYRRLAYPALVLNLSQCLVMTKVFASGTGHVFSHSANL